MRLTATVKLAGILMGIVTSVTLGTLYLMYQLSIEQEFGHLREMAQSQARLMEEGFVFDKKHFAGHGQNKQEAFTYTLARLREAHKNYEGFGETGEYTLARKDGEKIHFLLNHRHDRVKVEDKIIPFQKGLAEPMQLALEGQSGYINGRDYRGVRVLAAYEPLHVSERMGIVAKIDLSEMEKPFVYIGLSVLGVSLFLVFGGAILIFRVTDPLLRRLQKSESHYKTLLHTIPEIVIEVNQDKELMWFNHAGEAFFGSNAVKKDASSFFPGEHAFDIKINEIFNGTTDVIHAESLLTNQEGQERLLAWYCGGLRDEKNRVTGALATARDITKARASYVRLKEINRLLRIISECNKILIHSVEVNVLLDEIVALLHEEGEYSSVFIAMEKEETPHVLAAAGICGETELSAYLRDPESSISIKAASSLKFYIGRGEDLVDIKRFCPLSNIQADYSFGIFPFDMNSTPAVLILCSDRADVFNDQEIDLIVELAGDLSYGIKALHNLEEKRANEQHLRTLNLRYKMASRVSNTGSWEMWPQTGHFFCDNALKRLMGYDPEELGVNFEEWLALFHPEDRKRMEEVIGNMAEGDRGQHTLEIRFKQKDGSYRWYMLSGSRIDMEADEWDIFGATTDISDLKAAQQHFKELFDNMSSGMAVYRAVDGGEDFVFADINRAGERISRVTKEEVLGRKLSEVFSAVKEMGLFDALQRVYRSGEPEMLTTSYYQDERISQWVDNRLYRLDNGDVAALYDDVSDLVEKRKSEIMFNELVEQSVDAIFLLDMEGRFENVNSAACRSMGYTKEELLGMRIQDINSVKFGMIDSDVMIPAIKEAGEQIFETNGMHKDGTTFPVEVSAKYIKFEGRELIINIARDVTERKEAETVLKESEARYHALIDNLQDGVVIVDEEGVTLFANNIAKGLLGEKEVVGKASIFPLTELQKQEDEVEIPLRDGTIRHMLIRTVNTEWEGERVYQVTMHDITELRNAYKELEHKNEQFYNTIEFAPVPIMLHAEDGEVLRLNRLWTELTGYTKATIPTIDAWIQSAYPEQHSKIKKDIKKLYDAEGQVAEGQFTVTTANGKKLIWFFTSAPIGEHEDGRKIIISAAQDVTELHEKEEQMITQSRQAAMGDMIAMIAHQWRQPITVIAMAVNNIKLDLALDEEVTTDKLEGMIETVTEQTQHLSKTIDDFRDFFKPNKDKVEINLNTVVESALKIIGKSLENNNIAVMVSDSSTQMVETYPNELLQVLLNLITNAKDAHKNADRADAFIHIEIRDEKEEVCISICDNAGGIPEEAITKIGQPYFTTKKENGTGLGLYMSRTIIQKHMHGKLTWENKGEGACFNIDLPVAEKDA